MTLADTLPGRPATPADLAAVHALYHQPAVIPYLGFDPLPIPEFELQVYASLLAGGGFRLVECDGRLAAFYRLVRHPGRSRHGAGLSTFAVHPDWHGRGLARALLEQVIASLRAAGLRRLELTVEADNPRAIAFYERLGFEREGTLRQCYLRAGAAQYVDEHLLALLLAG